MPRIIIKNLNNRRIQTTINNCGTVLNIIHNHQIDWLHSCGGKGRCTSCKMIVLQGQHCLSPPTAAEMNYKQIGLLNSDERLACQCRLAGDIIIMVPNSGKLPHLRYTD